MTKNNNEDDDFGIEIDRDAEAKRERFLLEEIAKVREAREDKERAEKRE